MRGGEGIVQATYFGAGADPLGASLMRVGESDVSK
jgi:hypothetical protein